MKRYSIGVGLVLAMVAGGCGPSPQAVCDKMYSLAEAEIGPALTQKTLGGKDECVKKETRRKEMQGLLKYKSNNGCLMKAASWKDAKACSS